MDVEIIFGHLSRPSSEAGVTERLIVGTISEYQQ
jgi:hypothetical protein